MRFLIGALLLSYAVSAFDSGHGWDIPAADLLAQGASFGPAFAAGEVWRLISALFLHGGVPHLLFNSLALFEIGRITEKIIAPGRALTVFLLSGASGFLTSLIWQPDTVSVGASGGIFGLLGTWAVLSWPGHTSRDNIHPEASPQRKQQALVIGLITLALGSGWLIPNVDHAAHLGGLLTGLLLSLPLRHGRANPLWRMTNRSDPALPPDNQIAGKKSFLDFVTHTFVFWLMSALLTIGLIATPTFLPESWRVDYLEMKSYRTLYRQFAEEDRAINLALQALGQSSQQGKISDDAGRKTLEEELIPRLKANEKRLHDSTWTTPRIAADAARWLAYSQLRLNAIKALHSAVVSTNQESAQHELQQFEHLMALAAQLAKDESTNTHSSRQDDR